MEQGVPFATVRKEIYGQQEGTTVHDLLPGLLEKDKTGAPIFEVRNPVVMRALTEVRKVVNAIVREYGKPKTIRIELARDFKKGRKDRERIWKQNNENRKKNEDVRKQLIDKGIPNPKGSDIEKSLLYDECHGIDPYTGNQIGWDALFGPNPQFDVEHIIPFSRSLDNSFLNKTLCEVNENRNVKRNQTPWEAYGSDSEKWEQILGRVKKFSGDAAKEKLRRFQMQDIASLDDFSAR